MENQLLDNFENASTQTNSPQNKKKSILLNNYNYSANNSPDKASKRVRFTNEVECHEQEKQQEKEQREIQKSQNKGISILSQNSLQRQKSSNSKVQIPSLQYQYQYQYQYTSNNDIGKYLTNKKNNEKQFKSTGDNLALILHKSKVYLKHVKNEIESIQQAIKTKNQKITDLQDSLIQVVLEISYEFDNFIKIKGFLQTLPNYFILKQFLVVGDSFNSKLNLNKVDKQYHKFFEEFVLQAQNKLQMIKYEDTNNHFKGSEIEKSNFDYNSGQSSKFSNSVFYKNLKNQDNLLKKELQDIKANIQLCRKQLNYF